MDYVDLDGAAARAQACGCTRVRSDCREMGVVWVNKGVISDDV